MPIKTKIIWSGFAACALCGLAIADSADELTVTGSRVVITPVGIDYVGAPLKDVSMSYHVGVAGLDLNTAAGAAALDKRVLHAARLACADIERMYPVSKPASSPCVNLAVTRARAQVQELLASARRFAAN